MLGVGLNWVKLVQAGVEQPLRPPPLQQQASLRPRRRVRATEVLSLRASSVVSPLAPSSAALLRPPRRRPITAPARPMSQVRPATGAVSVSGTATAGASAAFRSATEQSLTV